MSSQNTAGNPFPILESLLATVASLEEELADHSGIDISTFLDPASPSQLLLDKLQAHVQHLDPISPDFKEQFRSLESLITARDEPGMPKSASSGVPTDAYVASCRSIVAELRRLFDELEGIVRLHFLRRVKDAVLSERTQWAIILSCEDRAAWMIARQVSKAIGMEVSEKAIRESPLSPIDLLQSIRIRASTDEQIRRTVRGYLDGLDYEDLFCFSVLRGMRQQFGPFGNMFALSMRHALDALRDIMIELRPELLEQEMSDREKTLYRRTQRVDLVLNQLRMRYFGTRDDDALDLEIIDQALDRSPVAPGIGPDVLAAMKLIHYRVLRHPESLARDAEEVRIAFDGGAFKLAVVGCGALLEALMKEAVGRETDGLDAARRDEVRWKQIFSGAAFVDEDRIDTWTLWILLEVARVACRWMTPDFSARCHHLRKARNRVHGGEVRKEHAQYGLETIKLILEGLGGGFQETA